MNILSSAVNGVVNAVTGRGKDDNAPVPAEEVEQTQGNEQQQQQQVNESSFLLYVGSLCYAKNGLYKMFRNGI